MHVFRLKGTLSSLDPWVPLLFEAGSTGLEEREGEVWAYFPSPKDLELPGWWEELPDEDWLSVWRRDLKPVQAGVFTVYPWLQERKGPFEIILEPGMAFGTGHHETTRLALEAIGRTVRPGMRVLDLGTGSGILAIAASLLGAQAEGLDLDPSVIPQAERNARLNQVAPRFRLGSLEAAQPPYDLLVANLYAELHIEFSSMYRAILVPGGIALLTGILSERAGPLEHALEEAGFRIEQRLQEGAWLFLECR